MITEFATGHSHASAARIRLLGPVDVDVGGDVLQVRQRRQQQLLAILAVHANETLTAERILDELWGHDLPATGVSVVASNIYRLRRTLAGTGFPDLELRHDSVGYQLRAAPQTVDVLQVERLAAAAESARREGNDDLAAALLSDALSTWRGEPMCGLTGPFVERERARCNELRLALTEQRIDVELARGRYAEVLGELMSLRDLNPTRESFAAQLMTALSRTGRQAEALEVFARTRRVLVDELGLEPGATMCTVHDSVLRGEPAAQPGRVDQLTVQPPPASERSAAQIRHTRCQLPATPAWFTGRDAEIDALVEPRQPGDVPLVDLITGFVGVGKSAVAVAAASLLAARYPDGQLYLDLRGTGDRPITADEGAAELLRAVDPDALDLAPAAGLPAAWRSACAGRRYLVVLDNAQDTEQVDALLPRSASCRVLITSRRRLKGLPTTTVVALAPLTPEAAGRLMAHATTVHETELHLPEMTALVDQCAGHAGMLAEIVTYLTGRPELPARQVAHHVTDPTTHSHLRVDRSQVAASIRSQIDTLDPAQRAAMRAALAMGRAEFSVSCLSWAELGDSLGSTLERLVDANLLRPVRTGWYTVDPLIHATKPFGHQHAVTSARDRRVIARP